MGKCMKSIGYHALISDTQFKLWTSKTYIHIFFFVNCHNYELTFIFKIVSDSEWSTRPTASTHSMYSRIPNLWHVTQLDKNSPWVDIYLHPYKNKLNDDKYYLRSTSKKNFPLRVGGGV